MSGMGRGVQGARFANQSEIEEADRTLLETPTGVSAEKDEDETPLIEQAIEEEPRGGRPRGDVTNVHDPGTDDETDDGLIATEEALRRGAEDVPLGASPDGTRRDEPVFDRSQAPPKV